MNFYLTMESLIRQIELNLIVWARFFYIKKNKHTVLIS
jgi:hypothetical protein